MAFPATPLTITVQAAFGADLRTPAGWVWTDISRYVRGYRDIAINRGGADEFSTFQPARLVFSLDNADGRFTPNNPTSPYYGLWGLDTPVRIYINVTGTDLLRLTAGVSQVAQRWESPSITEADVTADGILRRLGQGRPEASYLYRGLANGLLSGQATKAVGYWPMEDGADTTHFASALPGGRTMSAAGFTSASDSDLKGSKALPTVAVDSAQISGSVATYTPSTLWTAGNVLKIPTDIAGDAHLLEIHTSGSTVTYWQLFIVAAFPDSVHLEAYDAAGTELLGDAGAQFTIDGVNFLYGVELWANVTVTQVGANLNWQWRIWTPEGANIGTSGTLVARLKGQVESLRVFAHAPLIGSTFGHLVVGTDTVLETVGAAGISGGANVTAGTRFALLCAQHGVSYVLDTPTVDDSALVGPMSEGDFLARLREAVTADEAIAYELMDGALNFRGISNRYNRAVALALDYSRGHVGLSWAPVTDDQLKRNDWTVSRQGGASVRAVAAEVDTTSPRYNSAVPVYDDSTTVSAGNDGYLTWRAQWLVHLGTSQPLRYPVLVLDLVRNPSLISQWVLTTIGSRITVSNVPSQLAPDVIHLHVVGYTETFSTTDWKVQINCVAADPYDVLALEDTALSHLNSSSYMLAGVSTTATTLKVATNTATDAPWITYTDSIARHRDTFNRIATAGWSYSDDGTVWTCAGGTSTDFSVAGGFGIHSQGTVNVGRLSAIGTGILNPQILFKMVPGAVATGDGINMAMKLRRLDDNNFYFVQAAFLTTANIALILTKVVAGVGTTLATYNLPGAYTATDTYWIRCEAVGSAIKARIWKQIATSDTTDEPTGTWHVAATDTSLPGAGSVAFHSFLGALNTNTLPVISKYGAFTQMCDLPVDIGIGGERITVNSITSPAITFLGVGAASHADNTSLVPALPAAALGGDTLLCFAAIRSSGTGTVNTPTGWTLLLSFGNCALFGRIAGGTIGGATTDTAPTVSFTGGAAGDTTSAQVAAFRDLSLTVAFSSTLLNGVAANIAVPAFYPERTNLLVLSLGWKQDDWTSVATIAGQTEIGEPSSVLGNDQGLVWDYQIQTNPVEIAATSFVVTGGTNQISRGAVVGLAGDVQTFTVVRSVNTISKTHSSGDSVQVWQGSSYGGVAAL